MGGGGLTPQDHHVCDEIDSLEDNVDPAFQIRSPAFDFCGSIPDEHTCNGGPFGSGVSPELEWTEGPVGTLSYAIVFKDISIVADNNPALLRFAMHSVIWDIPANVLSLPEATMGGHHSSDVPGARQWGVRNNYGYLGPCPNPFPEGHPAFSGTLVRDSYAFTLYALDVETITDLPAQPVVADGNPATEDYAGGNWTVTMDAYLQEHALATVEYRGTSAAWSSAFGPPGPVEFPCADGLVIPPSAECLEAPE